MARKRLTQMFPWLLPLRVWQKRFCFYLKMKLDKNRYAAEQTDEALPCIQFETSCPMLNRTTGQPMIYQENKVFNLKLASVPLDRLLIRPGETFSFWHTVRRADKHTSYKDGLAVVNGRLVPEKGGGLCQLSNLLFWMFLNTPLTIVERHGHGVKDFPEPPSDAPAGVDATVSEGWLDLRVRNDTTAVFQIAIAFDEDRIIGRIYSEQDKGRIYRAAGDNTRYIREEDGVYEEVDIVRYAVDTCTEQRLSGQKLYRNRCKIGYPLPDGTNVIVKG